MFGFTFSCKNKKNCSKNREGKIGSKIFCKNQKEGKMVTKMLKFLLLRRFQIVVLFLERPSAHDFCFFLV